MPPNSADSEKNRPDEGLGFPRDSQRERGLLIML